MLNPITRDDRNWILENVSDKTKRTDLIGRITIATMAKDEEALKALRTEVDSLRGIEKFTPEQAAEVGKKVKANEKVSGSDILNCLKNGREVSKAFREACGL